MKSVAEKKSGNALLTGMMFAGIAAGVWSLSALMMGLSGTGWHVGELVRQYMVAVGMIGEQQTLVNYYTHIKGVEYIIAVAFLGAFPLFFRLLDSPKTPSMVKSNM